MQGDELTTAVFFAGSGIALVIAAVNQAGWKHRVLIWGLLGFGVLFCFVGLFLPIILEKSPTAASVAVGIATAPSSWFTAIFSIAVLMVVSKGSKKPPITLPIASQSNSAATAELERKVDLLGSFVSGQLAPIRAQLNSIDTKIAIDMPNASTVAEAFTNLHDSVHAKVKRIEDQVQRFSSSVSRDSLDLKHLLYLAILHSSYMALDYLLSIAPASNAEAETELNATDYKTNSDFLREVASTFSGTNRYSDYLNIMAHSEAQADERLRALPREQWPEGENPVEVRRYLIAAFQRRSVSEYIQRQFIKVKHDIRDNRHQYVTRYEERDTN